MVGERVALGVEAAASIHRRLFLVDMELQGIVVGVERQCPPQGGYKINVVAAVLAGCGSGIVTEGLKRGGGGQN